MNIKNKILFAVLCIIATAFIITLQRRTPNAVGKDGELGAYQIKKIYVDDANRIARLLNWPDGEYWTYEDRLNKYRSRTMTHLYAGWWAKHSLWEIKQSGMDTYEAVARIHNGGPNGWKKESTKPYWEKVKARMDSQ